MLRPRSTFSLAATVALLTVVAPYQPFSGFQAVAAPTAFEVPVAVSSDTSVKVSSGSDAMNVISDALKTSFEGKFNGAEVTVDAVGADQAIQSLLDGNADVAAISRPLSDAETNQGLSAVDVQRTKIAIIVGANNPFSGSLTSEEFAKIFRGEITNWSEVGGPSAPIRLVDRPDTSDTRLALAPYPVFKAATFATGANADQLDTDSPADVAQALGNDGIGYVLVDEVGDLSGVRTLSMHKTLPSDARYPFSQPFSLVYSGEPSPAVAAFLGYAAGAPGQSALKSANPLAGVVSAAGNTVKGAADAAGNAVEGAAGAAGNAVEGAVDAAGNAVEGAAGAAGDAANQVTDAADNAVSDRNPRAQTRANLWWLLLVPAACFGLVAWGSRRKNKNNRMANATHTANAPGVGVSGIGKAGAGAAAGAAAVGGAAWATTKQGGNVAKSGLGSIKGGLGNVGDAAKGGLGNVKGGLGNVGNAAKGGLGNVGDMAKGGLGNVGDAAKSGIGGIKGGLGNVGDAAKGGLGNIKGAAQQGVDGVAGGIGNVGNAAKGGLGNLQSGLGNAGDAAKGGLGNIKGAAQQGVDGVAGGLGNVGDAAKGGIGNLKDGLGNVGDAAKGGLGNLKGTAQQGVDGLSGGLGKAGNTVQGGIGGVGDGIKSGLGNVGDTVQGGANTVTGKLGGMADGAGNAVKNAAGSAQGSSKSLWQRVRDGVNQAGDQAGSVKDKASDIADDLKDLGK